MKVVIAAGGRFHAFHLAHQLEKRNALKKLFTFSYAKQDQKYISKNLIQNDFFTSYFDFIFNKLYFFKFINKSKLHFFHDNLFDFWLSRQIKKIGEVDIFVGWANYFLNSLSVIRKTGAKIIVECGSSHVLEQKKLLEEEYDKFGIKQSPVDQKIISKILSEYEKSDYIMTCSNFTYNSFIKWGVSSKKILKVPYGVNLDFFSSRYEDIHKKEKTKFRVICVGLMCLRKGIPYLLKAWNKLGLPIKESELLFVGNLQKDLKQVLKNIKTPKNVFFIGSVGRDSLADLYKKSSLFVLPSIEEGLSMVIAEAMANGLPVICTTNTGGDELIEDGEEGFIIPIKNEDILAEKIYWCYQNREESFNMGKKGQQKIKNFTWDHYGKKIFDIYKKILNKN